jgi:hypothetical protein
MKKLLLLVTLAGLLVGASGCATTGSLFAATADWVVGIYRATTEQIRTADQRASAFFERLRPAEKQALRREGVRYLAVRTDDPSPAQLQEIRGDLTRPTSRYGAAGVPPKVYCVMVWDTHTQEVVGTHCFAVFKLPAPGEQAVFDTFTAQFVGEL